MSSTRYWLLVLLIPMFGVFLVGFTVGPVELAIWLGLAALWVVAFIRHDRLRARVPIAVLGVVVLVGAGFTVYNYATMEGSGVTVERY